MRPAAARSAAAAAAAAATERSIVPRFRASDVAALIGRNQYRPLDFALLSAMNNMAKLPSMQSLFSPSVLEALSSPQVRHACVKLDPYKSDQVKLVTSFEISRAAQGKTEVTPDDVLQVAAKLESQAKITDKGRTALDAAAVSARKESEKLAKDLTTPACVEAATTASTEVATQILGVAQPVFKAAEVAVQTGKASEDQVKLVSKVKQVASESQQAKEAAVKAAEAAALEAAAVKQREAEKFLKEARRLEGETAALKSLATPEETKRLLDQGVIMQRGVLEEKAGLDELELRRKAAVLQRNSELKQLVTPHYVLIGKRDGQLEGEDAPLVELKKRRNWFNAPPEYDIIQVRVYLRLFAKSRGLLVEQSMSSANQRRETDIFNTDADWKIIDEGLRKCSARMLAIGPDELLKIAAKIPTRAGGSFVS